jgi:cytochrome P450/ferredoxin-NADP reductase
VSETLPPIMNAPQETEFEAVGRMFRSRDFDQLPRDASAEVLGNALVSLNGEEHRIRRAAENRLFAPESLRRYEHDVLEPHMERAFAALEVGPDGRAMLDVPPFVTELILNISLVLIGIDQRDPETRRKLFGFIEPLIAAHEVEWTVSDSTETIRRSMEIKNEYWTTLLEPAYRRRQKAISEGGWDEAPDLLSVLSELGDVDDDTVAQEAGLYLVASVLTSTATITDATEQLMTWLAEHPEDLERALDPEDGFLLAAIEESLRVRPPVKPVISRVAKGEVEVGGRTVEAGAMVGMNIPSAHVDPAVYPDSPGEFCPHREPAIDVRRTHYSFGEGSHLCIGRPLVIGDSRAGTAGDAVTIVRALLERGVRPDLAREPRLAPTSRRRYLSFPVTVEPTRRVARGLDVSVENTEMIGDHTKVITLVPLHGDLPPFTAGSHIDVEVPGVGNRSYSLANSPADTNRYVIVVRRDSRSRGGSAWICDHLSAGDTLHIAPPRNHFPLDETARHALLIAGGIGITPLTAMIHRLDTLGVPWTLWYTARNAEQLVFAEDVRLLGSAAGSVHINTTQDGNRLNLSELLRAYPDSAVYSCGPAGMLRDLQDVAAGRLDDLHIEFFENTAAKAIDRAYDVELASTGDTVHIPVGCTILDVLRTRGMDLEYSCSEGTCGTCEVGIISGRPDHRDAVLTPRERAAGKSLMICCSGSKDEKLVLDL